MNRDDVATFNAELTREDAQPAPPGAPTPAPDEATATSAAITDAALIAEIRANFARAVRIEFLPFWLRWPTQLADSLDLRWGPAR